MSTGLTKGAVRKLLRDGDHDKEHLQRGSAYHSCMTINPLWVAVPFSAHYPTDEALIGKVGNEVSIEDAMVAARDIMRRLLERSLGKVGSTYQLTAASVTVVVNNAPGMSSFLKVANGATLALINSGIPVILSSNGGSVEKNYAVLVSATFYFKRPGDD